MRNELHLMELVDRYLDGTLNPNDRKAFEERLRTNTELRSLMEDQRNLRTAAQRAPVRAAAKSAFRKYRYGKWSTGGALTFVVLVAAVAAFFLWKTSDRANSENADQLNGAYAVLNDTTGTYLPPFILTVDPAKDTTVITPKGIVLDIPRGAFVDDQGEAITTPVRVTLVEALDPLDIMKAGLSTMNGDTLLETGGMFYIDAQVNDRMVKIDPAKPLTAMVPATEDSQGMMLFQGVKGEDGIVDWLDPKPLKRSLVPVDITTLDFYPPGYVAKLAELGQDVTDKAFKDSLYYSFQSTLYVTSETGWEWNRVQQNFKVGDTLFSPDALGQDIFYFGEKKCSSCHSTTVERIGPPLKGAKARWKGQGNIYDFVRSAQTVIKSGNKRAHQLYLQANRTVMPEYGNLTDAQIDAVLHWADGTREKEGIDPAKVKAIWNPRFNNTNLATKAFEERMRAIHGTCDNAVLDAYVNALDKDLSKVDSQVVAMGHPEFAPFVERNDGRVDLPKNAAERLRLVYEHWSRAEAEAIRRTREKFWKEQSRLNVASAQRQGEHESQEYQCDAQRFVAEYDSNLKVVCKQLGIHKIGPRREPPITAYVANISNPGWWNVDRAVFQSTADRESMTYRYKGTGKTATLTYTPFTVDIADRSSYEDLKVYLIPKQLNSFQRVRETGGSFTEKLNSIFDYDLVCLGTKDGKQQAFARNNVKQMPSVTATLNPVDDNGLRQLLRACGQKVENGLLDEARFMEWSSADGRRSNENRSRIELKNALLPVVFPCAMNGSDSTYARAEK